jgi:adenosylmethionine-8-amino-7-oxononanoate aminotransferase
MTRNLEAADSSAAATRGDTRLWHPFAAMGDVRGNEIVITRGRDVWVWDDAGRRYLDGTASLWYSNVGHGRAEIIEAIQAQLEQIEAYSTFGDLANQPAIELASRLARLAPVTDSRVFFGSGGADAVDTALKLARLYWTEVGQSERLHIISRTAGYHGTHGFGTSIAGIPPNRAGYGDLIPHVSVVDQDSVEELAREIDRVGANRVAAFIFEPVIGAGGVYPPAEGYIEAVAELCKDAGILLIADSTICGFGRLGTWFGIERWDVSPDMIIFAKGVTSGYLPLGGLVVSGQVAEPFWQPGAPPFRHGQTYAGHATCCAAGLATLDVLESEELLRRGADLENDLLLMLAAFQDDPLVSHVRGGIGLLAALELDPELVVANPSASAELAKRTREAGVLVRPLSTAIAVSPPLTITVDHLGTLADGIKQGLDAMRH